MEYRDVVKRVIDLGFEHVENQADGNIYYRKRETWYRDIDMFINPAKNTVAIYVEGRHTRVTFTELMDIVRIHTISETKYKIGIDKAV